MRCAIHIQMILIAGLVSAPTKPALSGEVIWDFGPDTGEYSGCWTNITTGQNYADDVIFDQFMELTGIDVWTCRSPEMYQGTDMHVKILFAEPFREWRPGPDFLRWDMPSSGYQFDGNYGGTDLYKVSFDFDPVLLRADTRYWIGVSGNGGSLDQASIMAPGNGRRARMVAHDYVSTSTNGDQMFRLRGREVHPPFELSLEGDCPGELTANVIGATPEGRIAFLHGQRGGETTIPDGPCRGVRLSVGNAQLIRIVTADSDGNAQISGHVPTGCGTISVVAVDLDTCAVTDAARTYAKPELYLGPRIVETHGFADFNERRQVKPSCIEEGGMLFTRANDRCTEYFGWRDYCGGDGTPALYTGGSFDMLSVTRLDERPFDAIEFNAGDGYVNNCFNYLWIRAVLDGVVVADFAVDMPRWQTVGLLDGEFDEIRVGAYSTPGGRDNVMRDGNERARQALMIDNVRFGALTPAPTLSLTGPCPGPMTADISNATPNGTVALIFGRHEGQTPIPTGPCAGTILSIAGSVQLVATTRADPNGEASHTLSIPPPACGGRLIALDASTCAASGAVRLE